MSARWYKRCGADFIHGTMMLSLEEKGAYSLCLDLIYDRGGPIPDDARWLSGVCGVSIRKWNSIRERLVALGKITAEKGLLSNSRADLELVSAELSSRERAESGAKGGRKRAENAGQTNKVNGLAQAEPKPIDKIREDKKEVETNVSTAQAAKRVPFPRPEWAEKQVWDDFLENRKTKHLRNTATAYGKFLSDIARWQDAEWPPPRLLEYATAKGWGGIYNPREENERGHPRQPASQQSNNIRPSAALALYKRGALREAEEAGFSEDGAPDWGAGAALPAIRTG